MSCETQASASARVGLQVSAGVGPVEVRRFVGLLGPALWAQLAERGVGCVETWVHGDPTEPRSLGAWFAADAGTVLRPLVGTHCLVAANGARGRGSRKRWFAGVSLHTQAAQQARFEVDPKDVTISTCRSGGPGGQHVNTTSSAVRLVHRPTGLSLRVESERSQQRNRVIGMRRLGELLAARDHAERAASAAASRRAHYRVERGNAVATWTLDPRRGLLVAR